jgi:hypothetical protein
MENQLSLAAQEATFAYHTIVHNHSFKSMDCTTTIVRKLFNDKFSCSQTKCRKIITNVNDFLFLLIFYRVPFFLPMSRFFKGKNGMTRFFKENIMGTLVYHYHYHYHHHYHHHHHPGLVQKSH